MGCLLSKPEDESTLQEDSAAPEDVDIQVVLSQVKGKPIYRALYNFSGVYEEDLLFKLDDRLAVEKECPNGDDWCVATNLRTGKKGYVPTNYIRKDDDLPENQEWFFDINRTESVHLLVRPGIKMGTFLVRKSTQVETFVLSVRSESNVKHYKIKRGESDNKYYITPKRSFDKVQELLLHYKSSTDGLCVRLTDICPKITPTLSFRDLEVERSLVTMATKIGAGNFGEVWKGTLYGVVDVAVKKLKPGSMDPGAFLEEAKRMHQLRHKNLVQLIAVCTKEEPLLIISELMANGSLLEYLRKDDGEKLVFPDLQDMAVQVAEGMSFVEQKNFIHRDLRAANVLVSDTLKVKVADLGLARFLDDDEIYSSTGRQFPVKWTAPEAAKKRKFSIKSDVWSFGILLYEIITLGKVPYVGWKGAETIEKVDSGYRMPRPDSPIKYPDSYYDIMTQCWHRDPEERPKFAELCTLLTPTSTSEMYEDTALPD